MRTFTELEAFRAKAVEMGLPSLATAALDRLGMAATRKATFSASSTSRTTGRRSVRIAVRVMHEKTREENWVPLFDDAGVAALSRTDGRA